MIILFISTLFLFFYACYDKRNNEQNARFPIYVWVMMNESMKLLLFAFSAFRRLVHTEYIYTRTTDYPTAYHLSTSIFTILRLTPTYNR